MAEVLDLRVTTRIRGELDPTLELIHAVNGCLGDTWRDIEAIKVFTEAEAMVEEADFSCGMYEDEIEQAVMLATSLAHTAFELSEGPHRLKALKNRGAQLLCEVKNPQGLKELAIAFNKIEGRPVHTEPSSALCIEVARGALSRDKRMRREQFFSGRAQFAAKTRHPGMGRRIAASGLRITSDTGMHLSSRGKGLSIES